MATEIPGKLLVYTKWAWRSATRNKALGHVCVVIALLLGSAFEGSAQSAGALRFRFEPDRGMEYLLDGKYRMSDREITLEEGAHRFTFWAPERLMLDTTLFIVGDRTQEAFIRLRYSQDYVDHRKAQERYVLHARWGKYLPPVISAGALAWTTVSYLRYRKAGNALDDLAEEYISSSDPGRIATLKTVDIPDSRQDLRSARTQTFVASGVFLASAAATLIIRKRAATRSAPVFEDKERLRFEGLVHEPGRTGGIWSATFSIPIR